MSTYKIKKGDTLWSIAKRVYGDGRRYKELAEMNGISNPNKIYAGATLSLPGENKTEIKNNPPEILKPVTTSNSQISYDITPDILKRPSDNSNSPLIYRKYQQENDFPQEEAPQTNVKSQAKSNTTQPKKVKQRYLDETKPINKQSIADLLLDNSANNSYNRVPVKGDSDNEYEVYAAYTEPVKSEPSEAEKQIFARNREIFAQQSKLYKESLLTPEQKYEAKIRKIEEEQRKRVKLQQAITPKKKHKPYIPKQLPSWKWLSWTPK